MIKILEGLFRAERREDRAPSTSGHRCRATPPPPPPMATPHSLLGRTRTNPTAKPVSGVDPIKALEARPLLVGGGTGQERERETGRACPSRFLAVALWWRWIEAVGEVRFSYLSSSLPPHYFAKTPQLRIPSRFSVVRIPPPSSPTKLDALVNSRSKREVSRV